jgi:hypothetical protein
MAMRASFGTKSDVERVVTGQGPTDSYAAHETVTSTTIAQEQLLRLYYYYYYYDGLLSPSIATFLFSSGSSSSVFNT